MKKLTCVLASLFILSMTSMMPTEKNNTQKESERLFDNETKPLFHKGMITIKLKEGLSDFTVQRGAVHFNISSLDELTIKFEVNMLEKRFRYNSKKLRTDLPDLSRIYRIEFPEEISVTKVAREFSKDPNIEYAEPIPVPHLLAEPNDPMYGDLHYLTQIKADSAWDIHKGEDGDEEVVIAIVDSGVEWDHEDLVENIWQNMGEDFDGDGKTIEFTGGVWIFDPDDENGVDDDGNGFIDDFIGWNFFTSGNNPIPTPGTYKWNHGTLMGGYASASTNNNIGIASISWNLKILPLEGGFFNQVPQGYNAIIYAAENGADVITNSWGSYDWFSQANYEAIVYANSLGSIIVAGTANSNQFRNMYPASYPGVLAVAALSHLNEKASYSNFGPHISVSAPGGDDGFLLLTTNVNNSYSSASGTSCATPIVAGLLGLVKSYHPGWTSDQVITQVLGTADNIDLNNPGFENLLGSGCINAYEALIGTEVSIEQEIALDLFSSSFQDADSNHIPEPGDTMSLSIKLVNYKYGVGANNASFNLITDDPDIIILDDTFFEDIPADDYLSLENAFKFTISEQATTHTAEFKLITVADKEITWGDTLTIEIMVAPEGIFVFEGTGSGNAYSGEYINDFLVEQGNDAVFFSPHFPTSLNGFNAAFLSFGNHGIRLHDGTPISMEMTQTIADYLYDGGRIYIECGSFFGAMSYFEYPNTIEVLDLFGLSETQYLTYTNPLNKLTGNYSSICQFLTFTNTSQYLNYYIDAMTPNENGIAAFEEEDYGNVAVQGEGVYGQKTFCFSYALGHLEDNENGTRAEFMQRIYDFLFLHLETDENNSINSDLEISIYPNPFSISTSFEFESTQPGKAKIKIYNQLGELIEVIQKTIQPDKQSITWDASDLPSGIYFIRLQAGEEVSTQKVIKL